MTSLVLMRYFLGIEGFKSILKCHRVISEEFEMTDLVLVRSRACKDKVQIQSYLLGNLK